MSPPACPSQLITHTWGQGRCTFHAVKVLGKVISLWGPMVLLTGPPIIAEWLGHNMLGDRWRWVGLSWTRERVFQTTVTQLGLTEDEGQSVEVHLMPQLQGPS